MTTLLPKLVSDIIDWYQWKAKIKLLNNEYHKLFSLKKYYGVHILVYNENVTINWRRLIDHCRIYTFAHIYSFTQKEPYSSVCSLPNNYCCIKDILQTFVIPNIHF